MLNADPSYPQYIMLCKVYLSLCQINKSAEVDYYKARNHHAATMQPRSSGHARPDPRWTPFLKWQVRVNNEYRILIPRAFSKATSEYLEVATRRYTFSERRGLISYGELPLFDVRATTLETASVTAPVTAPMSAFLIRQVRAPQPDIHLHRVRFDAAAPVQSMVKYIEFSNVFRALVEGEGGAEEGVEEGVGSQYLIFIADNALLVEREAGGKVSVRINKILIEVATVYFSAAVSFVPCFKYADSEDMILFTSRHIHYLVDKAGQFNENYYGMKHELCDCILSEQAYVDANDDHVFRKLKLSEMLTESKTVLHFPDYLLQVQSQQQLVNLLDLAVYVRNVSFFMLVLFYLRRASIHLEFVESERSGRERIVKITGPWKAAIGYVLNRSAGLRPNAQYDAIFEAQFFDLNQHEKLPLPEFVEVLAQNFTRYFEGADFSRADFSSRREVARGRRALFPIGTSGSRTARRRSCRRRSRSDSWSTSCARASPSTSPRWARARPR